MNSRQEYAPVNVVSYERDPSAKLAGKANKIIPALDTGIYKVKFDDGKYEQYTPNILTGAIQEIYNTDDYNTGFITEMCGYSYGSSSVPKSKAFFLFKNGNRTHVVTTKR